MKTVYLEIGQALFKLPAISTTKGKYLWWALGPIYWILAFVTAMSVPQFGAFTNFVGDLFSLDVTYSLSAIMYFAYLIQDGARQEVEASILLRVRRLAMTVEFSDGYADLKGHGISACLFSSLRAAVLRRLVWVLGLPY